jgi:hypothetical protein
MLADVQLQRIDDMQQDGLFLSSGLHEIFNG